MDNSSKFNPGSWALFVFSSQMWMFLGDTLHLYEGDNYLIFGLILLISLPFNLKAGDYYLQMEDKVSATFFYTSGYFFGGPLALSYIVLYLGHIFPAMGSMDERIVGLTYICFAIWCIPIYPYYLKADKANCITWVGNMLWYFVVGLSYFWNNNAVFIFNVVLCIISAAGSTYIMLSEVNAFATGKHWPMGKPFFK